MEYTLKNQLKEHIEFAKNLIKKQGSIMPMLIVVDNKQERYVIAFEADKEKKYQENILKLCKKHIPYPQELILLSDTTMTVINSDNQTKKTSALIVFYERKGEKIMTIIEYNTIKDEIIFQKETIVTESIDNSMVSWLDDLFVENYSGDLH
ncbi:MAG: hypothetical protein QXP66_01000 [Candidatus Aenigmatarchaeota archaeon]